MRFPTLFKGQVLEEWRIHSAFVGKRSFSLFPVGVFLLSTALFFLFSSFRIAVPDRTFLSAISFSFLFLGLSVGAFGMFGQEVLNRRFGQASLLSYSSRILPVGERELFLSFVAKDVLYYSLLWVLPISLGGSLAGILFQRLVSIPPAIGVISLVFGGLATFLLGISVSFAASSVFSRSAILGAGFLSASAYLFHYFRSIAFSLGNSPEKIGIALALTFFATCVFRTDYYEEGEGARRKRSSRGKFFIQEFGPFKGRIALFLGKDFLDFSRSGGGAGKIVFSILLPLGILRLALLKIGEIIPGFALSNGIFPIFLGIILASTYSWFTDSDFSGNYSFLPVKTEELVYSKIVGTVVVSIPLAVLVLGISSKSFLSFLIGLALTLAVFLHSLGSTVFVSGLYPSIRLYSFGEFWKYSALIGIPASILAFFEISGKGELALFASLILVVSGSFLLKTALLKWGKGDVEGLFF